MRVLHLDSGREMRGGQWQVLSLLEHLGEGNVLLTPAEGPLMKAARERGIEAQSLTMLSLAALSRKTDLIHAHDARSHTWAASLPNVPLVVSRRVAFGVKKSFLSRWKYRRPTRFLAVSEHVKGTLIEAGVPEEKISVVYDGVQIATASNGGGERLTSIRTADPMKGTDLIEEAAKLGNFQVHYSHNLSEDLRSASVLIYITRSEGLGSAVLMAMAAGVAVVASDVGGLPEIVEHRKTGILTKNAPQDICQAISDALEAREQLGHAAREKVRHRFSIETMVERTRDAYRQVLD